MFRKFNSHFKTPLNFVNRSTNADLAPLLLHSCTVHSEAVHNSGHQFMFNCTVVPHANVYKYHQQNNHAHRKSVVIWQLSHKYISNTPLTFLFLHSHCWRVPYDELTLINAETVLNYIGQWLVLPPLMRQSYLISTCRVATFKCYPNSYNPSQDLPSA